ncbi:membrane protein insertion efficiency factor YidD [Hydrogenimonas sp.]
MIRSVLSGFLKLYQKFFTLLGYGSCRYYPTCSEYAKWQLETNPNLIKALFFSMLRILRCNQLFDGGIDYPKISVTFHKTAKFDTHPLNIRYWFVPDEHKNRCRVVKNIFSKGHS